MFPQTQQPTFSPNQATNAVGTSIFSGLKSAFNSIGSPRPIGQIGQIPSAPTPSPLSMGTLNVASNTQPVARSNMQPQVNTQVTAPVQQATPQINAVQTPQQNNIYTTPSGAQVDATTGNLQQSPYSSQQPANPLTALFNNPQNQQYIQQQLDVINRMAALQGQLAQLNVPSPTEISQQNLENQMRLNLANLNPQQYLKDNPNLSQGGISEGQLERQVAQEQMPLEQTLSQAIISRSALANVRSNEAAGVGAESQGLAAQSNAIQQARQLTMFGGLPPEIANTIVQRQLFPEFNVTQNLAGQPIAYNKYDPTQSIPLGQQGLGGLGMGNQQGIGGQSGAQGVGPNQNSINIGGLDIPVEHASSGDVFINGGRLNDKQANVAKLYSAQTGVPVLQEGDVSALHTIEEAEQFLPQFEQTANALLSPGLLGRLKGIAPGFVPGSNNFNQALQTDPQWRNFQSLRSALIKSVQGIAAGAPGLRVTGAELENAAEALPNSSDNLESAQQAISTFKQLLATNKQVLLGHSGQRGLYDF